MLIKGTALRSTLRAAERRCGSDAIRRVKEALASDLRAEIDTILPTRHYPPSLSAAVHEAIRVGLGGGDSAINYDLGIEAARIDFAGIYSIFLRVADHETSLRRLERAWQQYNSHGSARWSHLTRGSGRCVIEGVDGFTEPMWRSIAGRVAGMLLLAGARTATVSLEACSACDCALVVVWQP